VLTDSKQTDASLDEVQMKLVVSGGWCVLAREMNVQMRSLSGCTVEIRAESVGWTLPVEQDVECVAE
jgi:hypothetical protein